MFHIYSRLIRPSFIKCHYLLVPLTFCSILLHDKNSCYTLSDFKNVCVVLVIFTKMNCMSPLAKGKGTTFFCTEYMYTKCLDRFTTCILWFSHYSQEFTTRIPQLCNSKAAISIFLFCYFYRLRSQPFL